MDRSASDGHTATDEEGGELFGLSERESYELSTAIETAIASKSLTLVIQKPGYKPIEHEVNLGDLRQEGDVHVIELGAVSLRRVSS